MKAYKATYNFKCHDQEYKVGKTYTADKMKMCRYGIHFCQNMSDVINYYPHSKDFVLLEIEVLGNIETDGNKSATDKIKVLRVVPEEEYTFLSYKYEYDDRNNVICERVPDGSYRTYEYDDKNRKISAFYHSGGGKFGYIYDYDDRDNLIRTTTSSGEVLLIYTYDERGNCVSITDAEGHTRFSLYNEKNQQIAEISNGETVWEFKYDEWGNRIYAKNRDNHVYKSEYDKNGNMIWEQFHGGEVRRFEYDEAGRRISTQYGDEPKTYITFATITESD